MNNILLYWLNSSTRFVSPSIAKKYDFEIPEYPGVDQIVEVPTASEKL